MASVAKPNKRLTTPCGHLPLQIRALFVSGAGRASGWLADALAADSASEVRLEEAAGTAGGLARLREEPFDVVLVGHDEGLDSLEFLDALRASGGDEQAIVVLGQPSEQEMAAVCYEAGADAYVCLHTATTRALLWTVARAIERARLIAENRRLDQSKHRRVQLERDEATRLLGQQRSMIESILAADDVPGEQGEAPMLFDAGLPHSLATRYQELLRTYIVMGTGHLAGETNALVEQLLAAGLSAPQAVQLHIDSLQQLLDGLGNRGTHHIMSRADLFILEVTIKLAERYRGAHHALGR